jgi:two-component system response regulator
MTNHTIVLVEDNPDDAELMLRALRTDGMRCDVRIAHDGVTAIELLLGSSDTSPPAVVLLDLKLPGLDGFHVLQRIRGNPRTWNLPVVILTSSTEPSDLTKAYRLGANSYVRKPMSFRDLVAAAQQIAAYWVLLNQRPPANGDATHEQNGVK